VPWLASGDFNLLPPGPAYDDLPASQSVYYSRVSELERFFGKYASVPSIEAMSGPARADWYTHFPNDPAVSGPDRTIDYFFFPPSLALLDARIVRGTALALSDHLPMVARFLVP
jgi:endonuclease/exonuclease/phosphatase family metal-dependent hydrolase